MQRTLYVVYLDGAAEISFLTEDAAIRYCESLDGEEGGDWVVKETSQRIHTRGNAHPCLAKRSRYDET